MRRIVHVLVAEDHDDDALLIQRAFKANRLSRPAHIVHDGQEAIEYLQGKGVYRDRVMYPFPDLMILDLKMPRVSGFEVLQWLNEHPDYRVIPTIVWSASADRRDVKHAFCLGAHAYLCKPANYDDFVAMVGRLAAFWQDCEKPGIEPGDPECETLKEQHPFAGARVG
jgi:CheY-like chemotaxis protein